MRRILLMVFAVAMFVGLTTTAAQASSNSGPGHKCTYGAWKSGVCKPKPNDCKHGDNSGKGKCKDDDNKPEECKYGVTADHECMPKPEDCKYGRGDDGKCKPKDCPYGKDEHGMCKPPPVVYPPPEAGVCSKADLVLLEDLLKGTGALACVFLGDNAANADKNVDCAGALLALPLKPLIGACLFIPPADVGSGAAAGLPAVPDLGGGGFPLLKDGPLAGLLKPIVSLFKMG
jgi:hypothetical protein